MAEAKYIVCFAYIACKQGGRDVALKVGGGRGVGHFLKLKRHFLEPTKRLGILLNKCCDVLISE